MAALLKSIQKHTKLLLHMVCTTVLCAGTATLFETRPDYIFFITFALAMLVALFLYRLIFKNNKSDSFLKIVCALVTMIFANQLYSYNRLVSLIPWIESVNKFVLITGVLIVVFILMVIFKLISYIKEPQGISESQDIPEQQGASQVQQPTTTNKSGSASIGPRNANHPSPPRSDNLPSSASPRKEVFSTLRIIGFIALLIIVIAVTAYVFSVINESGITQSKVDFYDTVAFFTSYGASILFIFFAVAIAMITLIELMRFIYSRILLFKISSESEIKTSDRLPTYPFSVMIVLILFYLTHRISGFTMDKFTDVIVGGEYLALPLTLLVIIVAFCLLVRLTHGVLLLIMDTDANKVKKFLSDASKEIDLNHNIIFIVKSIVQIVFGTITSALGFVQFIPGFFESLSKMVLNDDNEEEGSAIEQQVEGSNHEFDNGGSENQKEVIDDGEQQKYIENV